MNIDDLGVEKSKVNSEIYSRKNWNWRLITLKKLGSIPVLFIMIVKV